MSRKSRAEAFVDEGYHVTVTGRHVPVTDSIKSYAEEKISRLERFSPRLIDVLITMDVQKLDHRVDIVMRFNNIKIKSHAISTDMYVSIDKAIDKIQNQIRKYKNKIQDHHARGVKSIDLNVNVVQIHRNDELEDINGAIEEANQNRVFPHLDEHDIIAQEKRPLKTLTFDEALMKMELSQDAFLIYRSEEDRKLKVIYRRNDNHYGVIEVET